MPHVRAPHPIYEPLPFLKWLLTLGTRPKPKDVIDMPCHCSNCNPAFPRYDACLHGQGAYYSEQFAQVPSTSYRYPIDPDDVNQMPFRQNQSFTSPTALPNFRQNYQAYQPPAQPSKPSIHLFRMPSRPLYELDSGVATQTPTTPPTNSRTGNQGYLYWTPEVSPLSDACSLISMRD